MWSLSRTAYFADWVTLPILACAAFITDVSYHGLTIALALGFAIGLLLWSFVEYATHRWLFHRAYRTEHWMHHIRPEAYVGVPAWQTGILAVLALGGFIGGFGLDLGAGLFSGLAIGYLTYITVHYWFHHDVFGTVKIGGYWDRARRRHSIHHDGVEANFGVVTPFWDIALGTFQR